MDDIDFCGHVLDGGAGRGLASSGRCFRELGDKCLERAGGRFHPRVVRVVVMSGLIDEWAHGCDEWVSRGRVARKLDCDWSLSMCAW